MSQLPHMVKDDYRGFPSREPLRFDRVIPISAGQAKTPVAAASAHACLACNGTGTIKVRTIADSIADYQATPEFANRESYRPVA